MFQNWHFMIDLEDLAIRSNDHYNEEFEFLNC